MDITKFQARLLAGSWMTQIAPANARVPARVPLEGMTKAAVITACEGLVSEGYLVMPDTRQELVPEEVAGLVEFLPSLECDFSLTERGRKAVESDVGRWLKTGFITISFGGQHTHVGGDINNNITINTETFQGVVANAIKNSPATDEHKQDALSKLDAFVSHPLVNTVLGAALGALIGKP